MSKFSPDEDDILCKYVQNHKVLFDMKNPEFKNTMKKDLLWIEAGKLLNKEGSECKKRWKTMRDHYKREKKDEKGSIGKSTKKKRAVYWERLKFLDTADDVRRSFTNADEPLAPTEESDIDVLQESEKADTLEQQPCPSPREISPLLTQSAPFVLSTAAIQNQPRDAAIQKYLNERKEDRAYFKRCMEEIIRQPLPPENDTEIDLFFKTMAATVKKFPPELATHTKASVFKIVTDMELLNHQTAVPHTSQYTNIKLNEHPPSYSSSTTSSP